MILQLNGIESKACSYCHILHPKTKEFWCIRKNGKHERFDCKRADIKNRQKHYPTRIVKDSRFSDKLKKRFDPENYIDTQWVLETQKAQKDLCFYCKGTMLYGIGINRCTNKMGLTVERLDNTKGHNKDNCVLCHKGCQGINHPRTCHSTGKYLEARYLVSKRLETDIDPQRPLKGL